MKTENKKIVSVVNLNSEEKNKIIKKYINISPMLCSCEDFAIHLGSDGTAEIIGECENFRKDEWSDLIKIYAGRKHIAGLKSDGTVVAAGSNDYGQCNVKSWRNIIDIIAIYDHTISITGDGRHFLAGKFGSDNNAIFEKIKYMENQTNELIGGFSEEPQKEINKEICMVSAGYFHTVGLRKDGTVMAVGENEYGQCDVENWQDIISISAGCYHTVGLKKDGTVVAVGENEYCQCNVEDWQDIIAISAWGYHTVGLKKDGTVMAVGYNKYNQCNVNDWQDIIAISAGWFHTVSLKKDGTVVAVGYNRNGRCNVKKWQDIIAISAGAYHTVGLKKNGRVVAVGINADGQCDVEKWKIVNKD